jgi:hypothetical protein
VNPGSIVRCRNREWVLLPAQTDDVFVLRPLTGTADDIVQVHRGLANLIGYDLPFERVTPASFCNRPQFLEFCPELVIVEEVHSASAQRIGLPIANDHRRGVFRVTMTPEATSAQSVAFRLTSGCKATKAQRLPARREAAQAPLFRLRHSQPALRARAQAQTDLKKTLAPQP